ncbi:hypothetical protein RISK_000319 [Rhodopirellula islandica]|uniref:Uncharacterized protein n=1 Tax=Rhodopirellula islandica TaxID=595434 RepID=A0A0J1BMD2_RHOIS|nr:hypothetical protein RISK_000319 [Rhodopirellula islandica]
MRSLNQPPKRRTKCRRHSVSLSEPPARLHLCMAWIRRARKNW